MRKSLILVSITLAGCGAFSTKNKGEKATHLDEGLNGTWQAPCVKADWLGFAYRRDTLKFSALGDFDRSVSLYSDANCSTSIGTQLEHGTYDSLGGSHSVQGATDINFTVTQASVQVDSDDGVKLLNDASYCGLTWQKGQQQDVLDKSCAGVDIKKGEVIFDVYQIGNNGKQLTVGKQSAFTDKNSADSRPTALDTATPFARQSP